ncbi:MAG: hypothetical protein K5880_07280 [Hydrogenophaga sp.]|jgi:hypothetical protein|uniref:hypothetical protein n=1 Tax=Hydrogenophaga sp. TaxID=1904254 RepID=UPI0026368271|nr:hypothetical protein [Hydrogenophaga sp.]MCV0438417.1 hypothetical protein [Hydrogenophaga sp.]
MSLQRSIQLLALCLLGLFFLPYILKLKQWDLLFILLAGVAMPAYDFLSKRDGRGD